MSLTVGLPLLWLELGALILGRVSGLLLLAPLFGLRSIPRPARVGLALALTLAVWPAATSAPHAGSQGFVAGLLGEIALGLAMGLVVELLFNAIDVASAAVSFASGLSYINQVDPTSPVRSTSISTFQWLLVTALFLAIDGHHLLVQALATSFTLVPPGGVRLGGLWSALAAPAASLLGLGVALAAPTLIILLLVDIGIGLMGRVLPQAQILMLGMGLKPLAGLFAMTLTYAALPRLMRQSLERAVLDIGRLVQAAS